MVLPLCFRGQPGFRRLLIGGARATDIGKNLPHAVLVPTHSAEVLRKLARQPEGVGDCRDHGLQVEFNRRRGRLRRVRARKVDERVHFPAIPGC